MTEAYSFELKKSILAEWLVKELRTIPCDLPIIPGLHPNFGAAIVVEVDEPKTLCLFLPFCRLMDLHVSLDLAHLEPLRSHGKIGMNCLPVTMELLIGHVGQFAEVEAELYAWLIVWLRIVRELRILEPMVNLFKRHVGVMPCYFSDWAPEVTF